MKYLKIIGLSGVGLLLIIIVVGYIQPGTVSVQSERLIKAEPCAVYAYAADIEKRLLWSPVENLDTAIITKLGTVKQGKGASYTWANKSSGASGRITLVDVQQDEYVVAEMKFGERESGVAHEELNMKKVKDGTRVTWSFRQEVGNNPFARIMGVFIREGMRPIYKKGTANLKEQVENDPDHSRYCPSDEKETTRDEGES